MRSSRILFGALAALFVGAAAVAQAPAPPPAAPAAAPPGPWLTLAPFPNASEEVLGATANGRLYVLAGLAPGWKPKGLVVEYDSETNKWTEKKQMPLLSHHVSFTSLNNKIYAFGGFKLPDSGPPAWEPIGNAWEYDPATDSWKALAPMPTKRGAAAAAVLNGKIYVIGGANSLPGVSENGIHPRRPHNVVATVEEYDPATNTWRERRSMLLARNHHVAAAVGNRLYAIGGRVGAAFITGGSNNVDLVEAYDPAADLWRPVERMPTARSAMAAGVHNNRIYVAGGEGQDRRMLGAFRAVEAYEPATNRWHIMPSMPNPRHGLAGAVLGDRLHLVSGDAQSAGSGAPNAHVDFHHALRLDLVGK
jgi:N-acetylneuraminic acid mutarotase